MNIFPLIFFPHLSILLEGQLQNFEKSSNMEVILARNVSKIVINQVYLLLQKIMNDYCCSISTKKGTTTLQKLFHGKKAHEAGSYNNNYHQNTYYNYLVIERPSRKTKSQFKRNILNFIHFLASSFLTENKKTMLHY